MKKIILSFLILIAAVSSSQADTLKGAALLNKVSMALRGVPAPVAEQKAISQLSEAEQKSYLNTKIDEYQKSEMYSEKMTLRLTELFQLRVTPYSSVYLKAVPALELEGFDRYSKNNAATHLFSELTQNNLSWDTLLTGKSYSISSFVPSMFDPVNIIGDYSFFGKIADLPTTGNGDVLNVDDVAAESDLGDRRITFQENDLRIAGVLTTGKFFARYGTTGVNKNRRRAAAIFRIFLCDRMNAAIPQMAGIDDATYAMLFPGQQSVDMKMTETEIKAILNKNDSIHGNKADCKSCHYKLDPVGKVFNNSGTILSMTPSPGALVFKNSQGAIVNKPVAGISELAQKITEEPDYVSCQVQHFWNWYIGEDKELTMTKRQELTEAFEKSGRKVNTFVKAMVLRSEFAEREEPNELKDSARKAKNFLVQCQACHQNSDNYKGVDLAKWPLKDADYWVKNIAKSLDLDNMGKNRTMPPQEGGFIPTKAELQSIRKWIELGAPDESGKAQIAPKGATP